MRVQIKNLTKTYGATIANDDVTLDFAAGKVHAVLGENGAGKSTVMSVLFGMTSADSGEVFLDDKKIALDGPSSAMAAGVGMVHQHFMLVPTFTVAENVMLGIETTKRFDRADVAGMEAFVQRLSDRHRLEIDPSAKVSDLSVGMQQRVEILKALARDARLLILDEPTAVLSAEEAQRLFEVMRSLAAEGRTVLFVTHRLNEVRQVADTVTVLRRGRVVGECAPDAPRAEVVQLMLGESKDLDRVYSQSTAIGEVVLEARDLHSDATTGSGLQGLSFRIRAGEIVGIAGVDGNGQSELISILVGLIEPKSGVLEFKGASLAGQSPARRFAAGMGIIAEDRHRYGMIGGLTVAENLILTRQRSPRLRRGGLLSSRLVDKDAEARIAEFDIRLNSVHQHMGGLSGGNQQKTVIARELARPLTVLVAAQPTRGVDVGAATYIHSRIAELRDSGVAVLLLSAELDEVLALSDRVLVLAGGTVALEAARPWPREAIGAAMSHDGDDRSEADVA